jgi:HlyD family secretion protein
MNRFAKLALIVIGLAVLIGVAVLFGRRGSGAIAVPVKKIALQTFQVKLAESGTVQHPAVETIPTLAAGNLSTLNVKAGDRVGAGELLATIENPTSQSDAAGSQADYQSAVANISTAQVQERNAKVQYQAAVETAKSALDLAQSVYDADANLYKNKAIARSQVDSDRTKLIQAQVTYQQALQQLHLGAVSGYGINSVQSAQAAARKAEIVNVQNQRQASFTQINAPFDGIIQTVAAQTSDPLRTIQIGDAVTAGQALFTIAKGDRFIVQTQVDEQDIASVRLGQRATVTGEDFGSASFPGHVAIIAPTAQKSTDASSTSKQVLTTIEIESHSPLLRDGLTADVDIYTSDIPNSLLVPNSAIVTEGGKKFVYVVKSGTAKKTAITTGRSNDTQTIVKTGIVVGDEVAIKPVDLTDGAKVKIASPSPAPSPSGS